MSATKTSVGITGFFDILGFGNRVTAVATVQHVADITALVKKIRSEFDYKSTNSLTKQVHKQYNKTILAFSDSVIVNVPLQSQGTEYGGKFDSVMSEITGFASAQGRCVIDGLFLRGGIDLGWWHRSGGTLISASMLRAYNAEGQANVPVFALTQKLYDYLESHPERKQYHVSDDPLLALRKYQSSDKSKPGSFWYLDYINLCVQSIDWKQSRKQYDAYRMATGAAKKKIMEDGYKENIDIWLSKHARAIEHAHALSLEESVKKKYAWLSSYHNEIAQHYTSQKSCSCTPK